MATINQVLEALLSAFPAPNSSDPQQTAMAYLMAIDGLPRDCVAEAVKRFIRGEVDRPAHRFLPSTAELAVEARRIRDERAAAKFKALPKAEKPAKPVTKEQREKVAAMMDNLAKRLPAPEKRGRWAGDPEAELQALAGQPVRVSSALIGKLQSECTK